MGGLIDDWGGPLPEKIESRRPDDRYAALVRSIAGQQLSGSSARAIWGRLLERFGGRPPTPQEILAADSDELRVAAGFSHAKIAALRSLAEHVVSGELDLDDMDSRDDSEIVRQLVAVRGIGQWTADLFLMFSLERPDVLPAGDLGIRNAARQAYGLAQRPSPAQLEAMGEVWRPYRTRASLYLWRSLRAQPL
jgi:DNA-3-methyladenine glycosylase II